MSPSTPPDAPGEFVSTAWATHEYRVRRATVFDAIHRGALPAIPVYGCDGSITTYALRPADLHALWGHRLENKAEGSDD